MQKKPRLSIVKMWKATSLSYDDLYAIDELLKTELSISQVFQIVSNHKNKHLLEKIEKRLSDGELIENVFPNYLPKNLQVSFKAFISYLSFQKTITLILSINQNESTFINKIQKDLTYPLCLLIFSIVGIYLFNGYCFKPMIDSMHSLKASLDNLYIFKDALDILITIIFILTLIILCALLYFNRPKRVVLAYIILQKYLPNSILKEYLTSQFILFFQECYKIGLKTKDSIEILKKFNNKPLIAFIASNIDKSLLQGSGMIEALNNPYLDERLTRFVKIALYSGSMSEMLNSYLISFNQRFKKYCQSWAKIIQVISYSMIGLVIIFIYQILFIPMGVLGGL